MTTAGEAVRKIFMNKRVNVNSNDCLSRDNIGQRCLTTSSQYTAELHWLNVVTETYKIVARRKRKKGLG